MGTAFSKIYLSLLIAGVFLQSCVSSIDNDYHPGVGLPLISISGGSSVISAAGNTGTYTVTNEGSVTATNLSFSVTSPFSVTGNTCGSSLSPGQSCTVTVFFAQVAGTYSTSLTVSYGPGLNTKTSNTQISGTSTAVLVSPICANATISAIEKFGSYLFIGGGFTRVSTCVGGAFSIATSVVRNGLAVLDTNGNLTTINPNVAGSVSTLTARGGVLYLSGSFSSVSGITRNSGLAALDSNVNLTSFNPVGLTYNAMAASPNRVYLANDDNSGFNVTVTALDTIGAVVWTKPSTLAFFSSIAAADDDTVYLGGNQGPPLTDALNSAGNFTGFNPGVGCAVDCEVDLITIFGNTIYMDGFMTPQPHPGFDTSGTLIANRSFSPSKVADGFAYGVNFGFPSTGPLWKVDSVGNETMLVNDTGTWGPFTVSNGIAYRVMNNLYVRAYNLQTGAIIW